jgi:hypothetical protein
VKVNPDGTRAIPEPLLSVLNATMERGRAAAMRRSLGHQPALCAFWRTVALAFAPPPEELALRTVIEGFQQKRVPRALGWVNGWARELYKRGVRVVA